MSAPVTFHGVLAGAYADSSLAGALLTHASQDGGETALCGRVKAGNLCDVHEDELTCPVCTKRLQAWHFTPEAIARCPKL